MTRIFFLGQKPLGEDCFSALLKQPGLTVCGACSNKMKDVWWGTNAVCTTAAKHGIPFLDNRQKNEKAILDLLEKEKVQCILSVQHSWILPAAILNAVSGFAFNLHCAPLPGYKGYNACNHAILNGETHFASTIHWMKPEVDMGDEVFTEKIEVSPTETAASLYAKTQQAGLQAFRRLLQAIVGKADIPRRPLEGEGQFYPRTSINELRRVSDPSDPIELDRKARAFWFPPFKPAYIEAQGQKYYLHPASTPKP